MSTCQIGNTLTSSQTNLFAEEMILEELVLLLPWDSHSPEEVFASENTQREREIINYMFILSSSTLAGTSC